MSRSSSKSRTASVGQGEPPEAVIGRLLKNMYQSARQAIEVSFRREGIELSFAHFATLYALASEPGVAGAALARRGSVTAQTMNTILRRLEQDGAIERRPHPLNQRADSWSLTKSGEMRFERAQQVATRVWADVFGSFSEQEVLQFKTLLERCLAGFEEQTKGRRAKAARAPAKSPKKRAR